MAGKNAHAVIPSNYSLKIEPLPGFEFECLTRIACEAKKPVKKIVLNAKELKVKSATAVQGAREFPAKVSLNEKSEELTLEFAEKLSGKLHLVIESIGKNNDGLYGFYRSSFLNEKNEKEHWLTTQFEAAHARACFPCFDHPDLKATFDVTMIVDSASSCVSNTPIKKQEALGRDKKVVTFETSPVMSSYLLYLGVGRFEWIEDGNGRVKIRVLTVPGKKELGRLSLQYGRKFLDYFEEYFGIKYPLQKLDLVAVPDFSSGAMENWGAITFREILLLANKDTSLAVRQRIAEVIAHELAHQWFGNLVTMEWWDDLWLNESFATFMAYKAVDHVEPSWKFMEKYLVETVSTALAADALKSTHPINVHVETPAQIDEIFDRISYDKGGSVLLMLEDFVGRETFRKGLHRYLKENSYANATKDDLWNSLEREYKALGGKEKVARFMERWVDTPGYPIVSVAWKKGKTVLEQKKFTLSGNLKGEWPVPFKYVNEKNVEKKILLQKQRATLGDLVAKANVGQKCFYRVRYDAPALNDLGVKISQGKLSPVDAWGVESDYFALARTGRVKALDYLGFVEENCLEAAFPLNLSVSGHLNWVVGMTKGTRLESPARLASTKFHSRQLARLGWTQAQGESPNDTLMRSACIGALGKLGHEATVLRAREMFKDHFEGKKELNPNLKSCVYSVNAWNGSGETFEFFRQKYEAEKLPEEQRRLLNSLADFDSGRLCAEALDYSLTEKVRAQDCFILHSGVASNPSGKNALMKLTKKEWPALMKRFTPGTHMLRRFAENLSVFSTEEELQELRDFFGCAENQRDDTKMGLRQAFEKIEANIKFLKANA